MSKTTAALYIAIVVCSMCFTGYFFYLGNNIPWYVMVTEIIALVAFTLALAALWIEWCPL
jgi:hypothetical protein